MCSNDQRELEEIVKNFTKPVDISGERNKSATANRKNMQNDTTGKYKAAVRTAYEEGIPSASINIYGDKWCVFGNDRVLNIIDDSLFFSERNVFGFSLMK